MCPEEGFTQSLGLSFSDHPAAPRGDGHSSCAPQDLELDWRALHAGNTEGHAAVVDLVVTVVLQEGVRDLGKTESLLAIYDERDYGYSVQRGFADLVRF